MSHIVSVDNDGHLVYDGLLSSQEKATVDEILDTLKKEISQIEVDLRTIHGNTIWYKYNLGIFLGDLLSKYQISISERRRFWDQVKNFASKEERKRDEGQNSVTRSFYQQCFVLSQYSKDVVEKLSWRQWQDLLDRVSNRQDQRLFSWIQTRKNKMREDDWREFEKGLHLYLKSKDTSVFSDEELFSVYDSIYSMSIYWREAFDRFTKEFPNSAKIRSKARRSKKYQATCFAIKKETRLPLNNHIFSKAFNKALNL